MGRAKGGLFRRWRCARREEMRSPEPNEQAPNPAAARIQSAYCIAQRGEGGVPAASHHHGYYVTSQLQAHSPGRSTGVVLYRSWYWLLHQLAMSTIMHTTPGVVLQYQFLKYVHTTDRRHTLRTRLI